MTLLFSFSIMAIYSTTSPAAIAVLPRAPITTSPVPSLTSLYHKEWRGNYGDPRYPGNCSGELIKDLLRYFQPQRVLDPMTGSGTCRDVCRELQIECLSNDLTQGFDATDSNRFHNIGTFDFAWLHPPYWRQKVYSSHPADLSTCKALGDFLFRFRQVIQNCADVLDRSGKLAILMGDYSDHKAGFVPLTYHTKRLCFEAGLRQCTTDIIRFSHGASSSKRVYRSSFIPGLHDVCTIMEKVQPTFSNKE